MAFSLSDFGTMISNGWNTAVSTATELADDFGDWVGDVTGFADPSFDTYSTYGMSPQEYVDNYTLKGNLGDFGTFLDDNIISPISNIDMKTVAGTAKATSELLYGKSGTPTYGSPKAKMISANTSGAPSGSYQASAVDLGYTPKVQNAMRAIQSSRIPGGAIDATIQMLRSRQAQGPLLRIAQTPIDVKSRAKETTTAS